MDFFKGSAISFSYFVNMFFTVINEDQFIPVFQYIEDCFSATF